MERTRIEQYDHVDVTDCTFHDTPGLIQIDRAKRRAMYLCPCGCGCPHYPIVYFPGEPKPPGPPASWLLRIDETGVTLDPSVLVRGACNAHYWIRGGRVEWC